MVKNEHIKEREYILSNDLEEFLKKEINNELITQKGFVAIKECEHVQSNLERERNE